METRKEPLVLKGSEQTGKWPLKESKFYNACRHTYSLPSMAASLRFRDGKSSQDQVLLKLRGLEKLAWRKGKS